MSIARDPRPVNLNLFKFHFPITAIASILHRISGVILFLLIPCLLWVLHTSLGSEEQFASIHDWLQNPAIKFGTWVFLSSLIYHFIAGIRHMTMDIGYAESLKGGRLGAYIVIALSVVFALIVGVWLW